MPLSEEDESAALDRRALSVKGEQSRGGTKAAEEWCYKVRWGAAVAGVRNDRER